MIGSIFRILIIIVAIVLLASAILYVAPWAGWFMSFIIAAVAVLFVTAWLG